MLSLQLILFLLSGSLSGRSYFLSSSNSYSLGGIGSSYLFSNDNCGVGYDGVGISSLLVGVAARYESYAEQNSQRKSDLLHFLLNF